MFRILSGKYVIFQQAKEMAEREGFEPPVRFHVRLISSQVHSTTLPPLRWPGFRRPQRAGRCCVVAQSNRLARH